jgi:FKBP-type peptidyl-prolyl cis-trans isomerase
VAYALSLDLGNFLKTVDSTANPATVAQGIADVLKNKPQMTQEEAYAFLNEYFNVRVPARNLKESETFLEEVAASNPNIQKTESGVLYEILDEGDTSIKATDNADQVVVKYRGTLKDGKEFDQNDSISFALNRVIPGWSEGMKLVGKGGHIMLWIPSDLAYGVRGSGNGAIPSNAAIVFDVELLDVIPATPAK